MNICIATHLHMDERISVSIAIQLNTHMPAINRGIVLILSFKRKITIIISKGQIPLREQLFHHCLTYYLNNC